MTLVDFAHVETCLREHGEQRSQESSHKKTPSEVASQADLDDISRRVTCLGTTTTAPEEASKRPLSVVQKF